MTVNPPYAFFFMSNGIGLSACVGSFMYGSFITRAFTSSRCSLDAKTMKEKTTVSPGPALAISGNVMPANSGVRSSPTHSSYLQRAVLLPDLRSLLRHLPVRRQVLLRENDDKSIHIFHALILRNNPGRVHARHTTVVGMERPGDGQGPFSYYPGLVRPGRLRAMSESGRVQGIYVFSDWTARV